MSLSFLLIGIDWPELAEAVGPEKSEEMTKMVKAGLAKDEARFKVQGLKYEFMTYGTKESMGKLEEKLKNEKYDGVCVGFGIRRTPEFTPLFENLVNTIAKVSPQSKLLFNTAPDGTLDAARRHFPQIKAE